MEESALLLLRTYEHALAELHRLDCTIDDHLRRFASAQDGLRPNVRDMAFLEGLRSERDRARADLGQAEHNLVSHFLSQLGLHGPAQE